MIETQTHQQQQQQQQQQEVTGSKPYSEIELRALEELTCVGDIIKNKNTNALKIFRLYF